MTILIILVVLFVLWPLIWRKLQPIISRYMARKAEDYIRRAAGMPPRGSAGRGATRQGSEREDAGRGRSYYGGGTQRQRRGRRMSGDEPLIPKEYAEDVEFVEIKDYSSSTVIGDRPGGGERVRRENQVSDADYVMIREGDKR